MHLLIEASISNHPRTKAIIQKFPKAHTTIIHNYKNYFDIHHGKLSTRKTILVAKSPKNPIIPAPEGYGFDGPGVFMKTSLGCIYDCEYCYLKGMFRNDAPVYYVDYEYIWGELKRHIQKIRTNQDQKVYIYCSDYSDIQGMDVMSGFNDFFLDRIDSIPNILMETRTKSPNIQSLMSRPHPSTNTEISFSLNPQSIIRKYEQGTASLDVRIQNINTLLSRGYKIGIRIMPLIPVDDYLPVYKEFIEKIQREIPLSQLHSLFIGGLMYTQRDFKNMQKKGHLQDMMGNIDVCEDNFVRLKQVYRTQFYTLFKKHLGSQCNICLDQFI